MGHPFEVTYVIFRVEEESRCFRFSLAVSAISSFVPG